MCSVALPFAFLGHLAECLHATGTNGLELRTAIVAIKSATRSDRVCLW